MRVSRPLFNGFTTQDTSVALYMNDRVTEERMNLYVYHMQKGWPDWNAAGNDQNGE
jgi:hypothetical protein